ncbi:monofunctional biosynthetic peptidoglycan transglycosylase [Pseudoprimorskyibacter insulae]|uniref:Biosynthetic peptidoglycan transglycosylase n=1 Tax=Pseudoprimorskyibacter insulae TaxID=1695997 RepID=A0A2R8AUB1_9RHOB|nr:monofunctional biosynthetic peptidoglycan transglycosylase [Pseudoprimorskyibacter insulae]SPF79625.1 Biosynthetic peptidoglycan transglycosylase [Pseudoprimorskyibacter insulae]
MAKAAKKKRSKKRFNPVRWLTKWLARLVALVVALVLAVILLFSLFNPPTTYYMSSEKLRLGQIDHIWVDADQIAPVMFRSVVAAEDANFCTHWGFDVAALKAAIEDGGARGASTISQQVVKNVFLWHGRTYTRKALEAILTPVVEGLWSKRRILEVYLNVAEFDEGVFGVEAAARHYFGVGPEALSPTQAARLAAILPAPKTRSASNPSSYVRRRAASIIDGAATIQRDGRAACFE